MNKKIAICVPVYKHRTDKLLENLHKIRKDLDIYIVTQDNDPKIDEYNQFVMRPKIIQILFSFKIDLLNYLPLS